MAPDLMQYYSESVPEKSAIFTEVSGTKSGSKYSHLSRIDPAFAPLKDEAARNFNELWKLPMKEFLEAWKVPGPLPDDIPVDLNISHQKVPVTDGTEIEIRVYKAKDVSPNALLYLKAHGGGWVVGTHDLEEAENRYVSARNNAVVVSVDYRM